MSSSRLNYVLLVDILSRTENLAILRHFLNLRSYLIVAATKYVMLIPYIRDINVRGMYSEGERNGKNDRTRCNREKDRKSDRAK